MGVLSTLRAVALVLAVVGRVSILVCIGFALSQFGTPDDDELGSDDWPRLDDHR